MGDSSVKRIVAHWSIPFQGTLSHVSEIYGVFSIMDFPSSSGSDDGLNFGGVSWTALANLMSGIGFLLGGPLFLEYALLIQMRKVHKTLHVYLCTEL